jgi:hypothetical protein
MTFDEYQWQADELDLAQRAEIRAAGMDENMKNARATDADKQWRLFHDQHMAQYDTCLGISKRSDVTAQQIILECANHLAKFRCCCEAVGQNNVLFVSGGIRSQGFRCWVQGVWSWQ